MGDRELEALRRHGFGVAYRMLGSVSEAEDVAQEALLRLTRQEGPIDEPAAWMTTVVTRLSINVLESARARREAYVGPWLPEPLLEDPAPGIKLGCVASNIIGKSGRDMLDALVSGTTDPAVLADLARGHLRKKIPALKQALVGRFEAEHAVIVSQLRAEAVTVAARPKALSAQRQRRPRFVA